MIFSSCLFLILSLSSFALPDRTAPPPVLSKEESMAPLPVELKTKSGIPVWVFAVNELPLVRFKVQFNGGMFNADNPEALRLEGDMWRNGVWWRSQDWWSKKLAKYGAVLRYGVGYSWSWAEAESIKGRELETLHMLRSAMRNPRRDGLDVLRDSRIRQISSENQVLSTIHYRAIWKAVFGWQHPYVRPYSPRILRSVGKSALKKAQKEFRKFGITGISVVGDIQPEHALNIVERVWGNEKWSKSNFDLKQPDEWRPRTILVNFPTEDRVGISVLLKMPGRESPDFQAARLANQIIGGGFSSRLSRNIREEKGLTYSIASRLHAFSKFSYAEISCTVSRPDLKTVLFELRTELKNMKSTLPENREFQMARSELSREFFRSISKLSGLSARFSTAMAEGLSPNFWRQNQKKRHLSTLEEVQNISKRLFDPEKAIWLISGDAEKIKAETQYESEKWENWSVENILFENSP